MILLVKESLAVGRTVQLMEHGHWMVLRWIVVILLDLLDVLDSSLDQLLCILLVPMPVVVMMKQYQKATTHVVLRDCVLVLDCGSLLQWQACFLIVSDHAQTCIIISHKIAFCILDFRYDSRLDSCTFIPPSDITAIPQQYMIQMNTSVFPLSRLASFIDCTNCDSSVILGESYYTLIDLTNERYQFTVPVNWSVDSNTVQQYRCRIRHGGIREDGGGTFIPAQQRSVSVTGMYTNKVRINNITLISLASSAPSSVSHEVVNATAIRVSWSITGNVSGFVIYIISSGLDTVTKQLTNSTIREYVVDGLLPERNYTIAVRGYYQLLGPAGTTTVRLEGIIDNWLTVMHGNSM